MSGAVDSFKRKKRWPLVMRKNSSCDLEDVWTNDNKCHLLVVDVYKSIKV